MPKSLTGKGCSVFLAVFSTKMPRKKYFSRQKNFFKTQYVVCRNTIYRLQKNPPIIHMTGGNLQKFYLSETFVKVNVYITAVGENKIIAVGYNTAYA